MFIVPGRTELILLSRFIACCECFIHLFSSEVQGKAPAWGLGTCFHQRTVLLGVASCDNIGIIWG